MDAEQEKQLEKLSGYVGKKCAAISDGSRLSPRELTELNDFLRSYERLDSQAIEWPTNKLNELLECGRGLQNIMRIAAQGMGADPDWLLGRKGEVGDFQVRGITAWIDLITGYSSGPQTPRAPLSDGPRPPNGFCWNGNRAELQPTPFKLLEFLWTNRRVSESDVFENVWGSVAGDNAIKNAVTAANKAIDGVHCPLRIARKSGYLLLE